MNDSEILNTRALFTFWNFTVIGYFGEKATLFGSAKIKVYLTTGRCLTEKACKICYEFASAAIAKYHRLSGLNDRNLLSLYYSGGQKFKMVSTRLVPSEGFEGESVPCCSPSARWFAGHPGTPHLCLHVPWPSPSVLALLGHVAVSEASSCCQCPSGRLTDMGWYLSFPATGNE